MVDPQRDMDRVLVLLDEHDVRLTHVFETHIHNDYVTGGPALSLRTGARYLVNGEDDVSFDRPPVADGQVVEVGDRMRVTALATPGHTFTRLSYAWTHRGESTGEGLDRSVGVFSGGSLLYGATGRPDLLGPEHTHDLVRHQQHASAHRLSELLPDDAAVYPTHGFGSFCSATRSGATSSTIGREKQANPVLPQDEQTYVDESASTWWGPRCDAAPHPRRRRAHRAQPRSSRRTRIARAVPASARSRSAVLCSGYGPRPRAAPPCRSAPEPARRHHPDPPRTSHVQTSPMQDLRQDHLGGLRAARRDRQSRRPGRSLV